MIKVFDPDGMRQRQSAYYRFARGAAPRFFNEDGSYKETVDPDRRTTFWIFPALIDTEDAAEREFALRFYAADPAWEAWDIFITSSIAVNLVRERERLTPELIRRSEDHLDRFCVVDGGRKPCSGANDYMFHGYNDNMPAMATRALILAGDVLGRDDLADRGIMWLETLCAHLQRRGLVSEYNSSTYTPVNLTALMDVAECSTNEAAIEMALACARRILLDFLCHWHRDLAAPVGSSSRAYLADCAATLSNWNTLAWYVSGDDRLIDPISALQDESGYDGPVHHGPDKGFMVAQMCEFLSPSYEAIGQDWVELANRVPAYPHSVRATLDSGRTGCQQTTAWSTESWGMGTASSEMWAGMSGQHLTLAGVVAARRPVRGWQDRIGFWQCLQMGEEDLGVRMPAYADATYECSCVHDHGAYHVMQKRGTAMLLGHLGTSAIGKETSAMKMMLAFGTRGRMPDEVAGGDSPLPEWEGTAGTGEWSFLRFGDVYVGIRAAGMVHGRALPVRRSNRNNYLRIELPIVEGETVTIDADFRKWLDVGIVVELADKEECGSFAAFMSECRGCAWEFGHCFYRNSRYTGRNGELHMIDSIKPDSVRFRAVDGRVEEETLFEATGLDARFLQLFDDGRFVRQRRLWYDPRFIGSPFYDSPQHVIVTDG